MKVEEFKSFGNELLVENQVPSAIWVLLDDSEELGFKNPVIDWMDWKLGGFLARTQIQDDFEEHPLVFAAKKRLGIDVVFVEKRSHWDSARFLKSAEGLKWESVFLAVEGEDSGADLVAELSEQSGATYPKNVGVLSGAGKG